MRSRRGGAGQATVELAFALPVVLLAALAIVQLAVLVRDQLVVLHAAREGARAAAVDPRPATTRATVIARSGLKPARVRTDTRYEGGSTGIVLVRVRYRSPTDVPIIGPLFPDVEVEAQAAMRSETEPNTVPPAPWSRNSGRSRVIDRRIQRHR